jgi:hypothetical protein
MTVRAGHGNSSRSGSPRPPAPNRTYGRGSSVLPEPIRKGSPRNVTAPTAGRSEELNPSAPAVTSVDRSSGSYPVIGASS